MALEVERVQKGSIAAQLGIQPGDVITHMGGEVLRDCIDSMYFEAEANLLLSVRKKDGSVFEAEIEKEEYEPLGVEFVGDGLGKSRGCANHCVFCFVDQLPKGMRQTLYFKDDDWRMSFIMGNYITLTNVSDAEFERILARKTSPLYISVHATDDDLRAYLIGQERARGIMQRLTRLKDAGICFNCQVVCCPGLNDGNVLEKTISDLAGLYPACESLAIVPLGMTGHREGLTKLTPMDRDSARGVLRIAEKWQQKMLAEQGTRFVFCSDELYIRAEMELPPYEAYEEFAQMEDGVGMVRNFLWEVQDALENFEGKAKLGEVSVATGADAAQFLRRAAEMCQAKLGVKIHVYPILNDFFGHSITVTGLLTGGDIIRQLEGRELGERLVLSATMLRDREDVFLDDMSLAEFCGILKVPCIKNADGYEFVRAVAGSEA